MTDTRFDLAVPLEDLAGFQRQMDGLNKSAEAFSRTLAGGLKAAVLDGKSLESVFKRIALSASSRLIDQALAPLSNLAGQALSGILPFAKGGVVSSPALFGLQDGIGLMGEAGAEAIMPLARGADGRLGVRTGQNGNGAGPPVQITVVTRDAESFARSETQVSAMVARAVGRGRRGL
ncbi:phage tail tape measure protein [Roseibium denhamense]|uniref:Phage tail tape measure protein, lambda family n=1 Tax=Roseibium denhamense TaxID=76305 RepID=A0ABY1PQX4_9HYPH|nr:phage tail tape measure protein [Roseibium denhamense]MTI05714.1 phage tail tape measure protein [Roseibium denhamense]SMP36938.1 phage tail tape measure protein, lambda family [Roseibium denhamense]